jgi:hypothetical protein
MTSHTTLLQMLCNATTQLLEIIEGQSQTLGLSAIGNPNDITYTLYNDGVESTSSNIYVNNNATYNITTNAMQCYM